MSFLTGFYTNLMKLLTPLLTWVMHWRLRKGYEPKDRFYERLGYPSVERPTGTLVWFHGASMGESLCALPVIGALKERYPHLNILITTVTECSADLLKKRLPEGVIHQYAPVDAPAWIDRFMNHWHPDMSLWIESELWPYMIACFKKSQNPIILINAKLSQKSVKKWRYAKGILKGIMGSFTQILAQNEKLQALFESLGATNVYAVGNLKTAASPLPHNEDDLGALIAITAGRPLWVAASTHPGDENFVIKAHTLLKVNYPELLTIIVPRHPQRAAEIGAKLEELHLSYIARSHKTLPQKHHEIYLVDTLGELGLFYRLADIAFIGGAVPFKKGLFKKSLGGHNPLEAAILGCATLLGPDMRNNQDAADRLLENDAAYTVKNGADLASCMEELFQHHSRLNTMKGNGLKIALSRQGVLDQVMHHLTPYLDTLEKNHEKNSL